MFIDNPDPAWSHGHLSDLITVKYGKDHKKLADGIYPVYGSGGIMRYVERPLYNKESVLIPRKGTLNNVMYVNQPFWSVDTMFYTEMKLPNVAKFVYHFVKAKDLASMHVSYLNNAHDLAVINKWKKQTYTDPDGDSVYNGMSAYDYVTTHLGYRYCLLSSSFEHKNNAFVGSLQITLKNEGFAPSYKDFDVELFIIKDDNSAAPTDSYSAAADNTDIVYSANLTEKYPASTWTPGNEINLDISVPLLQIKKAGNITKVNNYSIYLVVRDKISGEIIKFANDASYNDYGYYIGSLKI